MHNSEVRVCNIEMLLGESDLSNVAFSIIEKFSTHQCLQDVLVDLFNMIGSSLGLWVDADHVSHVFVNTNLGSTPEAHRWLCRPGTTSHRADWYQFLPARPPQPHFTHRSSDQPFKPILFQLPDDNGDDLVRAALPEQVIAEHCGPVWVTQFDFANHSPLGAFVVSWVRSQPPLDATELLHVQNALWNLAHVVSALLCNHYVVHENTYLPSYQLEGPQTAAILSVTLHLSSRWPAQVGRTR